MADVETQTGGNSSITKTSDEDDVEDCIARNRQMWKLFFNDNNFIRWLINKVKYFYVLYKARTFNWIELNKLDCNSQMINYWSKMFELMLMELEIIWPGNNFVGRTGKGQEFRVEPSVCVEVTINVVLLLYFFLQRYSSASVSVTVGSVEVLNIGPRLCVRLVKGEMPTISTPISPEVHDVRQDPDCEWDSFLFRPVFFFFKLFSCRKKT